MTRCICRIFPETFKLKNKRPQEIPLEEYSTTHHRRDRSSSQPKCRCCVKVGQRCVGGHTHAVLRPLSNLNSHGRVSPLCDIITFIQILINLKGLCIKINSIFILKHCSCCALASGPLFFPRSYCTSWDTRTLLGTPRAPERRPHTSCVAQKTKTEEIHRRRPSE